MLDKFDFLIKKFFNFFKSSGPKDVERVVSFYFSIFIFFLFFVYFILGIYIVSPSEQAVVTRFGRYSRTVGQGPHWLPLFIESKVIVNTEKLERSGHSAFMLTRDENIVSVDIEVQYRVEDVEKRLFRMVDPDKALKQASESALRQVIGQSTLDFIVTSGKEQIASSIHEHLQNTLDSYESGMHVSTVALKDAKVPKDVKTSFDDVIKAQEQREQLKHQAESYANKLIPEAKGVAARLLEDALALKQEVILSAEGDVSKFNLILPEYSKSPVVTSTRLYLDALDSILKNTNKVLVDSSGNNLIYIPLDSLLNKSYKSGIVNEDSRRMQSQVEKDVLSSLRGQSSPGYQNTKKGPYFKKVVGKPDSFVYQAQSVNK